MARARPTKTQKTVNNINRYIKRIAQTFGQFSEEYEQVTRELHGHGFELRTDKSGVIQLANTKSNRRQHQTIRAIKNRQKPINILARKYRNLPPPPTAEGETQSRSFIQWYAESMKDFKDLYDEVYNYLIPSCDELGISHGNTIDYIISESARREKWEQVFESGARDYESAKEFLKDIIEKRKQSVNSMYEDTRTGEVVTQTNEDFEDFAQGWTDIEY